MRGEPEVRMEGMTGKWMGGTRPGALVRKLVCLSSKPRWTSRSESGEEMNLRLTSVGLK